MKRRLLACLLAAAMACTMAPGGAFASESPLGGGTGAKSAPVMDTYGATPEDVGGSTTPSDDVDSSNTTVQSVSGDEENTGTTQTLEPPTLTRERTNSGRGANLTGLSIGAPETEAQLEESVNIITTGAENTVYNIDEGKAVMISGKDGPIEFKNCTFNLSGETIKISGNQDGIVYNNGEVVTKLWIGDSVRFENCKFITENGEKSTGAGFDACIYFFSGDITLENCSL